MSESRPAPNDQAKMWAALSYGSFFIGFPLGVIPLVQRDDPYALHHAKKATAVWLVSFVLGMVLAFAYTFISFATCGFGAILFPMVLLPVPWVMAVAIHGLVISLNGQWDEPIGVFGLGDLMFSSITPKALDEPPQLLPPGPPPPPPPPPPPVG
jgi:hypothetical protein